MIKAKSVEQIISTAKVDEVIEDFVNLKKRGVNLIGLCPFHSEKTPSFTVSPSKNLYKCFGCGRGGNSVSFVMDHESLSFPEALKYLAQKYNIEIEEGEHDPEFDVEQQKRESYFIINQFASERFRHYLSNTDEGKSIGLSYFKHRGLLGNTIEQFELGYAPKSGTQFSSEALDKGFKKEYLEELGLSKNDRDFFRERVVFPFHNLSGKIIGFGARSLSNNPRSPKYLNSSESDIYNKRNTLYGLYQAKTEIRREDQCILVEGYTDVLSLSQNLIKNVVSSSGTSLTSDQVRLIKRFTPNATVLYDGDQAGQNAALRGLSIFLENDMNVSVVLLPENEDPDSYIRKVGTTEFKEFLNLHSKDFILFLAHRIQRQHSGDPIKKSQATKELLQNISLIRDQLKRSLYIKECAIILAIDEAHLTREINKFIRTTISNRKKEDPKQDIPKQSYVDFDPNEDHSQGIRLAIEAKEYQELDILRIIITAGHSYFDAESKETIADYIQANLNGLDNAIVDENLKKALTSIRSQKINDPNYWVHHQDEVLRSVAIDMLSENYYYASWAERGIELQTQKMPEENFIKDSYQAIMRFKLQKIQEQINDLSSKITSSDDERQSKVLLNVYQKLLLDRKKIASELKTTIL